MRRQSGQSNRYAQLWRSKGFVFVLIGIVIFLGVSVTREVLRRFEIHYEIQKLEGDVARLEKRNTDLKDVIALLNSSSIQDKEARVKLGLQSQGENVVLFPDRDASNPITLPDSDAIRYIPIRDYQSNPEKWFGFFWDKLQKAYTL
jgi:cell division protein FtsL